MKLRGMAEYFKNLRILSLMNYSSESITQYKDTEIFDVLLGRGGFLYPVDEFKEQLDDNLIQDRYVQLMSSSPGEDTSLDPEYAERLVHFSELFAKDPRYSLPGFLSIPLDLCRIPNGQTSSEGGESFFIPFSSEKNLKQLKNAARDMSENKQNYEEQIAKEV